MEGVERFQRFPLEQKPLKLFPESVLLSLTELKSIVNEKGGVLPSFFSTRRSRGGGGPIVWCGS